MQLLRLRKHMRKMVAAIDHLNEFEEKTPPFLIHHVSRILESNIYDLRDFFKPSEAVTFSQQFICIVKQAWQVPQSRIPEIIRILRVEFLRATKSEQERVIELLRITYFRSHGSPFDIAAHFLAGEPVTDGEILTVNDNRFDFDLRLNIVMRLFTARNNFLPTHAVEYARFIGALNDGYRQREREAVLELAKKAPLLPHPEIIDFMLTELQTNAGVSNQGRGALILALVSFGAMTIDHMINHVQIETESDVTLCRTIVNALSRFDAPLVQALFRLYAKTTSDELRLVILRKLHQIHGATYEATLSWAIKEFVGIQKKHPLDQSIATALSMFDAKNTTENMVIQYLSDPKNKDFLKQIKQNGKHVIGPLMEIVADKSRSLQDREAALYALSKINFRDARERITTEILKILQAADFSFQPIHYSMFDCLRFPLPALSDFIERLLSEPHLNIVLKTKAIATWDRIHPESPRPKFKE